MDYKTSLLILQFGSFMVTTMLALVLAISRLHIQQVSHRYESSRWNLFGAMVVLAVHYLLQMIFGFRAQGDDVGALINILFYSPASIMICFSNINLTGGFPSRKRFLFISLCSYILSLIVFLAGWYIYGSLHMEYAIYLLAGIYFCTLLFATIDPLRDMFHFSRALESNTGFDLTEYTFTTRLGLFLVSLLVMISPLFIFTHVLLSIMGGLFMLSLSIYIISFVCLGFTVAPIMGTIDWQTENEKQNAGNQSKQEMDALLNQKDIKRIEGLLNEWIARKGFRNPNTSIASVARTINLPQIEISRYIAQTDGVTFRVWLSKIRLEEAKRLIEEHPNFSNEVIAAECGFTSRTYFQNVFKEATGFTPKEWSQHQRPE